MEDNILPYINDFDEDYDEIKNILEMNDIFQTGSLSSAVFGGAMEKYGVKLS